MVLRIRRTFLFVLPPFSDPGKGRADQNHKIVRNRPPEQVGGFYGLRGKERGKKRIEACFRGPGGAGKREKGRHHHDESLITDHLDNGSPSDIKCAKDAVGDQENRGELQKSEEICLSQKPEIPEDLPVALMKEVHLLFPGRNHAMMLFYNGEPADPLEQLMRQLPVE